MTEQQTLRMILTILTVTWSSTRSNSYVRRHLHVERNIANSFLFCRNPNFVLSLQNSRKREITGTLRLDRTKWSDSPRRIDTLFRALIPTAHLSKPEPLSSFDDCFWAKCMLLQVLHEIAHVRWRGLWCFGVNTSFELFGGWSRGAIRLLSINLTSSRRLSHTHAHMVGWNDLTGERWRMSEGLQVFSGYLVIIITFSPRKDLFKDTVRKTLLFFFFFPTWWKYSIRIQLRIDS